MYICLCHGITDTQIRSCIASGARTLNDLRGQLGVATQCGSCEVPAREMLQEALAPARLCGAHPFAAPVALPAPVQAHR